MSVPSEAETCGTCYHKLNRDGTHLHTGQRQCEDPISWRTWPTIRILPGPHPRPTAAALAELGAQMDAAAARRTQ